MKEKNKQSQIVQGAQELSPPGLLPLSEGTPAHRGVLQALSWPLAPAGALSSPSLFLLFLLPASANTEAGDVPPPPGLSQPVLLPGVMLSEQCGSQGMQGGSGDRLEGLKRKRLLLGCSSACCTEVIPTFDFLEAHPLPGSLRRWEKEKGKKQ